MRKLGRTILLLAVCASTIATVRLAQNWHFQAAAASFKEFTLIRSEMSRSRGPSVLQRTVLLARRADGARVEGEIAAGDPIPRRRIVYLGREGMRAEVNDTVRGKTTLTFGNITAPVLGTPDPQCGFSRLAPAAKPLYKGEAEVAGIKTVVIQTEQGIGGDSYLRTEWRAPELDCAVLRVAEERRDDSGTVTGQFTIELSTLTVGPPNPALFEIPDDYREMPPSEMRAAVLGNGANSASPPTEAMRRRLEREDQEYRKNREAAER